MYGQLKYDKFSDDAIKYALDKINVDWKDNARRAAIQYDNLFHYSKDRLYEQLIHDEYTPDEANYAVNQIY